MLSKKKFKNKIRLSFGEALFSVFNYTIVTLIAATMLYPLLNLAAISLSSYQSYLKHPWMIIPIGFHTTAYEMVFSNATFWRSYLNSVIIVVAGTFIALTVTSLAAYALSRKELKGKGFFMGILLFIMLFGAGMVPGYLNIKELHLLNTLWVLILPGCISAYNCILMINFFRQIAYDMIEAAMIDGASEPRIFTNIVLPLSKPVMASIALFLAVGKWNGYFGAQIYIKDPNLWPMALVLKEMLYQASTMVLDTNGDNALMEELSQDMQPISLQYASVLIATIPILCIYPFLQKYFAKGVMLGGVKG